MSKKTMLLALAVVSAAMFALPAVASAGEWKMDCPGGKATCAFTTSGGHAELRAVEEPTITCTGNTGEGTVSEGGTTGTFALTFTGCKAVGFVPCNTSGAGSGVIKVASSVSHNVYLEDNKTKLGILVTPATTTIICSGLSSIDVTGSVIGELQKNGTEKVEPAACNEEKEKFDVNFTNLAGNEKTQQWELITKTDTIKGPFYDLSASTEPSGTAKTATEIAKGTIAITGGKAKTTCP
jgi:hypothetical protein